MFKIIFITFFLFLSACKSATDAITLKKKSSADEFLVEKKNPLVLPPDFGELPKPIVDQTNEIKNIKVKGDNDDIKKLFENKDTIKKQSSTLEETILKKIK